MKKQKRITKREAFLNAMDNILPWDEWVRIIRPYYPNGKRGRPPIGIEIMLRMYLLQIWFSLSDEGLEDALYDSKAMMKFLRLDIDDPAVPDATTLLHFRHLIEDNHIGEKLFKDITERLDKSGQIMHGGTIVDATIISAPSSTKNQSGKRDPEMHSTKKGNQFYFGYKAHTGVDAGTGYAHSITATPANVHDITEAAALIRDDDEVVYGDSGYVGMNERDEFVNDSHLCHVDCRICRKPSSIRLSKDYTGYNWDHAVESRKASVRCKVEHIFHIVKDLFGYRKAVYRGIEKNLNQCYILFASANLLMCARAGRDLQPLQAYSACK